MPPVATKPLPGWLPRLALVCVLLVSAWFNLQGLDRVGLAGLGDPYHAASVWSMLQNGRNAFFVAFDPAGLVSLPQAPLVPWLHWLLASLLGHNWASLLLPQALAGIASVYVLYRLVGRAYGVWPGLLAALTLAVTPISVVTQRSNLAEAWTVLSLLAASWCLLRAIEAGARRALLSGAALVGLAFHGGFLQALLVLPVLVALFWQAYPMPRRLRWQIGLEALLVLALVAAPWLLAVELTPAAQRPWLGGTRENHVIELLLGYRQRAWLPGEDWRAAIGLPGPQRIVARSLAGQISWLLPLALLGGMVANRQLLPATDAMPTVEDLRRRRTFILLAAWVAWQLLFFSTSNAFHRYHLVFLAPGMAGLVGIGAQALWRYRHLNTFLLVLLLTCLLQITIMMPYGRRFLWIALLVPNLSWVCYMAIKSQLLGTGGDRWPYAIAMLALLIAPAVWAWIPVSGGTDGLRPYAGPQVASRSGEFEVFALSEPLLQQLQALGRETEFVAATDDRTLAGVGILATGQPWMLVGVDNGGYPIMSEGDPCRWVREGRVRTFVDLEPASIWPPEDAMLRWVGEHCPPTPSVQEGVHVFGPCVCAP